MEQPTSNGVSVRSNVSNEDRILQAIFDPEHPLPLNIEFSEDGEAGEGVTEVEPTEEVKRAKELELRAVRLADPRLRLVGDDPRLREAVDLLNRAVAEAPHYASAYNNRAQVYRLQNEVDLALTDLDTAIRLSGRHGRVAEQAYTQRGLIHRLQGKDEQALEDFKAATKLGSNYARQQATSMHPIAALCNRVVTEIFDKQQRGEQT